MKKTLRRTMALLLTVLLLTVSMAAAAEPENVLFRLSITDLQMIDGEGNAVDLGLALNMALGADASLERAMAVLAILAGDQNALTLYGAVEDGAVKVYANSAAYSLPFMIEIPLEEMITEATTQMTSDPSFSMIEQQMGDYMTMIESLRNPEAAAKIEAATMDAIAANIDFAELDPESITMFGATFEASVAVASLTLEGVLKIVDAIYSATPEMSAYWESMKESATADSGQTWDDIIAEAAKIDMSVKMYSGEGDYSDYARITGIIVPDGEDAGEWSMDIRAVGEDADILFALAIPAADVSMTMELSVKSTETATKTGTEINGSLAMGTSTANQVEIEGTFMSETVTASGDTTGSFSFEMNVPEEDTYVSFDISAKKHDDGKNSGGTIDFALATGSKDDKQEMTGSITYSATEAAPGADGSKSFSFIFKEPESMTELTVKYDGTTSVDADGFTAASGQFTLGIGMMGMSMGTIACNVATESSAFPAGALLTVDGVTTINPMTAGDSELDDIDEAFQALLTNAAMILMQVPAIAGMFGGMMGGDMF